MLFSMKKNAHSLICVFVNYKVPHKTISKPWRFSNGHLHTFFNIHDFLCICVVCSHNKVFRQRKHICIHLSVLRICRKFISANQRCIQAIDTVLSQTPIFRIVRELSWIPAQPSGSSCV